MFPEIDAGAFSGPPAATAIFTTVLTEGPVSRVALARRLGLSSAAVTKAARPLIDLGYLHELAATERSGPGAGRPASPLAVRAEREFFLGVKITADEVIGVVCDLRAQVQASARRPLDDPDVDAVLAEVGRLTDDLFGAFPGDRTRVRRLGSGPLRRHRPQHRPGALLAVPGLAGRAAGPTRRPAPPVSPSPWRTTSRRSPPPSTGSARGWGAESSPWSPSAPASAAASSSTAGWSPARTGWPARSATSPSTPPARTATAAAAAASRRSPATDAIVAQAREPHRPPRPHHRRGGGPGPRGDEEVREVFARAGGAIGCAIAAVANLVGPDPHRRLRRRAGRLRPVRRATSATSFERQAFGAAARCPLSIRPLPFEEWARGAAAVSIQSLVVP